MEDDDTPSKWHPEKSSVAVLISDKIDCKIKKVIRDQDRHFMIEETTQQEEVTLTKIYVPNLRAPKYIKQLLTDL